MRRISGWTWLRWRDRVIRLWLPANKNDGREAAGKGKAKSYSSMSTMLVLNLLALLSVHIEYDDIELLHLAFTFQFLKMLQ